MTALRSLQTFQEGFGVQLRWSTARGAGPLDAGRDGHRVRYVTVFERHVYACGWGPQPHPAVIQASVDWTVQDVPKALGSWFAAEREPQGAALP